MNAKLFLTQCLSGVITGYDKDLINLIHEAVNDTVFLSAAQMAFLSKALRQAGSQILNKRSDVERAQMHLDYVIKIATYINSCE